MTISELSLTASYAISEGFNLEGVAALQLSDFKELAGGITFNLLFDKDKIAATVVSETISAFGMSFSELELSAEFTKGLDLEKFSGKFNATHPAFSTSISVSDFQYGNTGLQVFDAAASFTYQYGDENIDFVLNNSSYDATDAVLVLDALARKTDEDGSEIAVEVRGFKIDLEGNISIEEISAEVVGNLVMGPVIVTNLKTSSKRDVPEDNKKTRRFTGTGNVSLRALKPGNETVAIDLGEVSITYRKFDESDNTSFISGSVSWAGAKSFLDIYGINGTLREVAIEITDNGSLTGFLSMTASLEEDKNLANVLTLKEGVTGDIKYVYGGSRSFAGEFDLSGLDNINIDLNKGGETVASLQNGTFGDRNVLTGTLAATPGVAFNSNGFDIALNSLDLNVSYSFPNNQITFNRGAGQLTVSNISGFGDAAIKLGIEALGNENLIASVATDNAELKAFGFTFDPGSLKATVDNSFDLKKIYGENIAVTHDEFDSDISIAEFEISEGTLQTLKTSGSVTYKGFDFTIKDAVYANNALSVDAMIMMNLTGTQGLFAVKDFTISESGAVSISQIEGSLENKDILTVEFDATFSENRFVGGFSGAIIPINLGIRGSIDIGKETSTIPHYNFAFLSLGLNTGRVGFPLGLTGFKIDKFGGRLGYNYRLDYQAATNEFIGSPDNGRYLIGMELGISDVTNSISVSGSPLVQFGNDEFNFSLEADLKIPKKKPIIESALILNYSASRLSGNFTTNIKLPRTTGKILRASAPLSFEIGGGDWLIEGNGINGTVLDLVNFEGGFRFDGKSTDDSFKVNTVKLNGRLYFNYSRSFSLSKGRVSANATISADFEANTNLELDNESGLVAEFTGRASGELTAEASILFIDLEVSAGFDASATVGYNSAFGGYMDATGSFHFKDLKFSVPLDVGYRFDGENPDSATIPEEDPGVGGGDFGEIVGTKLVLSANDLDRITADPTGGVDAPAFEDIEEVEVLENTYSLPKGLKIKVFSGGKIFVPGFCFVAGTPIKVNGEETRNIEAISVGDEVMSYHHGCEDTQSAQVTALMKKSIDRLVKVGIGGEVFLSTENHPYFANGKYIEAGDLTLGDSILTINGSYAAVESLHAFDTMATVYNFTVAGNHNYYIGDRGYLVHNDCNFLELAKKVDEQPTAALKDRLENYYNVLNTVTKRARVNFNKKIADLKKGATIREFINDFGGSSDLPKLIADNDLVDGWRVLEENPVLRKRIRNLRTLDKWLDTEITFDKLKEGIANSDSKQNLLNGLATAVSVLHVRVMIKDYENIPGIVRGRYRKNSSLASDKRPLPATWSASVDLPDGAIKTFTEFIDTLTLLPGDKIYRVSSATGGGGAYWTRTMPISLAEVIGGTAVLPQWNNFQYIYAYIIPPKAKIRSWVGKAARQPVARHPETEAPIQSNFHLPGGAEQLFISFIGTQDPSFEPIRIRKRTRWSR